MPENSGDARSNIWWTEFVATLLLGLAAVGAGWAAYQSTLWDSDSLFAIDRSAALRRQAGLLDNSAHLLRIVDIGMFTTYMQAVTQGNKTLSEFVLKRFRPPMKAAVTAWLATDPVRNPNAPPSPFAMKEYHLTEEDQAQQLHDKGEQVLSQARHFDRVADDYVLVTVPFAIVSLFSGLSTKFAVRGIRFAIVIMAVAFFIAAVVRLAYLPVTR